MPDRDVLPDQGVCTACRGAKTFPPMDITDDDYVCGNCDGTGVEPEPDPPVSTEPRTWGICRGCGSARDLEYCLMCDACVRGGVPIPKIGEGHGDGEDIGIVRGERDRLRAEVERLRKALASTTVHTCREWVDEKANYCHAPAEFLIWGKLTPPNGLGPRCYDHAAEHVGHRALGDPSWAIVDLRPARLALQTDDKHADDGSCVDCTAKSSGEHTPCTYCGAECGHGYCKACPALASRETDLPKETDHA